MVHESIYCTWYDKFNELTVWLILYNNILLDSLFIYLNIANNNLMKVRRNDSVFLCLLEGDHEEHPFIKKLKLKSLVRN